MILWIYLHKGIIIICRISFLGSVCCHGTVEEFHKKLVERKAQRKKKRRILRRKIAKDESDAKYDSSDNEIEPEPQPQPHILETDQNNVSVVEVLIFLKRDFICV